MYFNKSPNKESTRFRESRNLSYAFLGTSVQIIQVAEKKVSQPASAAINQSKLVFALSLSFGSFALQTPKLAFWVVTPITQKCHIIMLSLLPRPFHGTSASSGHEQVYRYALEEFHFWGNQGRIATNVESLIWAKFKV